MPSRFRSAFFAYPGSPPDLVDTIAVARKIFSVSGEKIALECWPQMSTFGDNIPDEVREKIRNSDVLICDITKPNMNVYYEAGFAIGRGKAIAPVINTSFSNAREDVQRDGLFDNIGYRTYENSSQLSQLIRDLPSVNLIDLYARPINFQQPLFLLDTFRKTDFRNAIVSAVKESKVFYRSFDPVEVPRFSAVPIIADATSSAGLIIPILADHIDDAARHNLRAAFLAGLTHGLDRRALLLQLRGSDQQNPADYRDLVTPVRNEGEIRDLVIEFAAASLVASQSIDSSYARRSRSALQTLTLGSSAAENEFRTLEAYFVETSEFLRTLRGEVGVVAGRKGSGKTAIFFQARDRFRQDRTATVTDLKPESHQLSLFREQLLKVADIGVFDHTIAAFWYFVFLSEILLTIKRGADFRSKFDSKALGVAVEIEQTLATFNITDTGDFTSRITRLGSNIAQEIEAMTHRGEAMIPDRLTNIIFRNNITRVREQIQKHTNGRYQIVVLFDNVDKGWPAAGVNRFDIRLVRLMLEALDKIRLDLGARERDFKSVVFLRNDIYELLVEETPDRGKAAEVRIDWTDRAKLRQVIFKRLQSSVGSQSLKFEEIWLRFFVPRVGKQESFEYFVDHCLMRPRFLINIIENAIANGINRGHDRVEQADCIDAVRQHSNYLVNDFGYEIRDVSGLSADILYSLIGVTKLLTQEEVLERFRNFGISEGELTTAFRLMLWYGVLGMGSEDGRERYIYDYEYNMKRLEAEIRAQGNEVLYVAHPAIHVGLSG